MNIIQMLSGAEPKVAALLCLGLERFVDICTFLEQGFSIRHLPTLCIDINGQLCYIKSCHTPNLKNPKSF